MNHDLVCPDCGQSVIGESEELVIFGKEFECPDCGSGVELHIEGIEDWR